MLKLSGRIKISHVVIKSEAAFEDIELEAASSVDTRSLCLACFGNALFAEALRVTCAIVGIWALHHLWMLGSASCVSVGGSKGEILPSDRVSKACFQSMEMLLNLESSAGSILNMLKSRRFDNTLLLHAGDSVLPASILVYVIEITCSTI